jgi:hypothetical protein
MIQIGFIRIIGYDEGIFKAMGEAEIYLLA